MLRGDDYVGKTVVSFCTGGTHYAGDCFVFDAREAVAADLQPASGRVKR